MDSESLKIFCTVATELSITQAAARLGRAPSNVTTRIQQLETGLGAALFVRTGKRIRLSGAGEQLLAYAQRLLALEEEARHVVSGGLHGGCLRIGSIESCTAARLPSVLVTYHARHPHTRLEVHTAPSRQLIQQVCNGGLDCAFVALPPAFDAQTLEEMGLQAWPAWREELLLVLPAHEAGAHSPAQVRTRSLATFASGCTYRLIVEEVLGIAASTEWRIQEMGSYHAILACVAAGICITALPQSVLALTNTPPELVRLPLREINTSLIWRKGYDTPAFRRLLAELSV